MKITIRCIRGSLSSVCSEESNVLCGHGIDYNKNLAEGRTSIRIPYITIIHHVCIVLVLDREKV